MTAEGSIDRKTVMYLTCPLSNLSQQKTVNSEKVKINLIVCSKDPCPQETQQEPEGLDMFQTTVLLSLSR